MAPTETLQVALPTLELPTEDGIPLESGWHRGDMNLMIESLRHHWRDRPDFYCGGNMFLYYSLEQVRNRDYRGPDFFVVLGVDGSYSRKAWVVWEEEGRYPDLIVELLSPTTAEGDKKVKRGLYERTFRTPEYYCYDPETEELVGWRLAGRRYEPIRPDDRGRLWSEQLGLWLGRWEGVYQEERAVWLRFYTAEGHLVLLPVEAEQERAEQADQRAEQADRRAEQERQWAEQERQRAEQERQRAEQERQRAEQADQRAEQERQRAEQADQRAEQERQRAERLAARLRALGLEPEEEAEP